MKSSNKAIFECPRKGVCASDCNRCDIGNRFSDLRKIIFQYSDKVKQLKHALELEKHPELKEVDGSNDFRKFPKGVTGKQCEFIFIDDPLAEKDLDKYYTSASSKEKENKDDK